jgi:hypothetical protein
MLGFVFSFTIRGMRRRIETEAKQRDARIKRMEKPVAVTALKGGVVGGLAMSAVVAGDAITDAALDKIPFKKALKQNFGSKHAKWFIGGLAAACAFAAGCFADGYKKSKEDAKSLAKNNATLPSSHSYSMSAEDWVPTKSFRDQITQERQEQQQETVTASR